MGKRNNGLRKPFSFQTVSKQHQRCAWQWWRHPMRSRPSQSHIAPVPFSTDTASSSSRELEGCLWSLCKAKPSEMSLAAAAADGACGGPDAACMAPRSHPLPHSPRKAAGLVCLGWEWVRIGHLSISPAAEKKIYFGEMRGLQPSFWSATVLFYAGVTAGLSYVPLLCAEEMQSDHSAKLLPLLQGRPCLWLPRTAAALLAAAASLGSCEQQPVANQHCFFGGYSSRTGCLWQRHSLGMLCRWVQKFLSHLGTCLKDSWIYLKSITNCDWFILVRSRNWSLHKAFSFSIVF